MQAFTQEQQQAITPDQALEMLKQGNQRFVSNTKIQRDLHTQMDATKDGQYPFAAVLSCIDSRASVELIFDQGIGDVFNARIAGNVVNEDILGSFEFACKVAGAKLILVLGHSACGAVKGACDHVELGHLTGLLNKIAPSVAAEHTVSEARNAGNAEFVEKVAHLNVEHSIAMLTEKSAILKDMVQAGQIKIVGAKHNIATGEVLFFD